MFGKTNIQMGLENGFLRRTTLYSFDQGQIGKVRVYKWNNGDEMKQFYSIFDINVFIYIINTVHVVKHSIKLV